MSTTTSPTTEEPAWKHVRAWRNNNPGNLRPLLLPATWYGQSGLDEAPGGPFSIFRGQDLGWRALGICLLTYYERHGLDTVGKIIGRYAPALENDTGGYVSLVCGQLAVTPTTPINPREWVVLQDLMTAIALAEGGARIKWPEAYKIVGIRLALDIPVQPKAPPPKD